MSANLQRTKVKAFAGLIFLLALLWLGLILPTMSLDFWQGWVYWSIFSLSTIIVTVYLLKKNIQLLAIRTKVGPIAEQEKSQKIIQLFASIFFILLIIIPGFDHRFHWSSVPLALTIIGDIMEAVSFVLIFLVFRENSYASGTIETEKDQMVVMTGPYRFVRHPMYAGGLLLLVFTPLALGSYVALLCSLLLSIVIVSRLHYEEEFLKKNLPGYTHYCQQTPYRLFPFIW